MTPTPRSTKLWTALLFLCACGPTEAVVSETVSPPTASTSDALVTRNLFFDDFESGAVWAKSLDGSVACSNCKPSIDDIAVYSSPGWPGHGKVMTVHANPANETCTTTNVIAHRPAPYGGPGNYQFTVEMRQWRGDAPYLTHQMDINYTYSRFSHVKDGKYYWKDWFSEVGIITNPFHAKNGWLYMKARGDKGDLKYLADLKLKSSSWLTDWHKIIVNNVIYPSSDYFYVESIYCDGVWYPVHEPMGTFWHEVAGPNGWSDNETVMLETANSHQECSTSKRAQGVSVFDNVRGVHYP